MNTRILALKQKYIHHTELLYELVQEGRIKTETCKSMKQLRSMIHVT